MSEENEKIKVVYIEDHAGWYAKMEEFMSEQTEFELCPTGPVDDYEKAIELVERYHPEVLILDHVIGDCRGHSIAHHFADTKMKIISFSKCYTREIKDEYPKRMYSFDEKDFGFLRFDLNDISRLRFWGR